MKNKQSALPVNLHTNVDVVVNETAQFKINDGYQVPKIRNQMPQIHTWKQNIPKFAFTHLYPYCISPPNDPYLHYRTPPNFGKSQLSCPLYLMFVQLTTPNHYLPPMSPSVAKYGIWDKGNKGTRVLVASQLTTVLHAYKIPNKLN